MKYRLEIDNGDVHVELDANDRETIELLRDEAVFSPGFAVTATEIVVAEPPIVWIAESAKKRKTRGQDKAPRRRKNKARVLPSETDKPKESTRKQDCVSSPA